MTEVVHNVFFALGLGVWAGLIIISIHPRWGAEFGMWLRGDTAEPYTRPPAEAERESPEDPLVGQNLDRKV